jgi:hypothetical protein
MVLLVWFVISKWEKLDVFIGIKDDGTETSKRVQALIASQLCKFKPVRLPAVAPVMFLGADPGVPKKKREIFLDQEIR